MYYLTPDQEKKLRAAGPQIDALVDSGDIIRVREVVGDQIIYIMDENQDPTKESIAWEKSYDRVIFYMHMKEKSGGPFEIQ